VPRVVRRVLVMILRHRNAWPSSVDVDRVCAVIAILDARSASVAVLAVQGDWCCTESHTVSWDVCSCEFAARGPEQSRFRCDDASLVRFVTRAPPDCPSSP
jgi:hypothetical protein